jgi:hypothetical protein
MVIKKILKELEKITNTKEKIAFLIRELKKIDNEKLQEQLEIILQQIIDQESLEERITLKQPEIQTKTRTVQTLERKLPQRRLMEKQEEEIEKIDYKLFEGEKNYTIGVNLKLDASRDPLENNPNKPPVEINPYTENTDNYKPRKEGIDIHPDRLDDSTKDFSTEAIIRRKKLEKEETVYQNGKIPQ